MPRSDQVLLFCLGGALLSLAFLAKRPARNADAIHAADIAQEQHESPVRPSYNADYQAFAQALQDFRGGRVEESQTLRACAQSLSERHQRLDAPRVVEYYAALSPRDRRIGLDNYDEFVVFWKRVRDYEDSSWTDEIVVLREDLQAFVARTLPAADFVPAGRALSLLAEIEVQWLEFLSNTDERRDELLQAANEHAREALAVFERAGMQTPRLEPLWLLGRLAVLQGEEERGRRCFEECLALAERVRVEEFRERALVRLVRIARGSGDVRLVQQLLAQLARFRSPDACWELARQHSIQLIHDDEAQQAAEFLIAHRPSDEDDMDAWRCTLAIARLRKGELLEARRLVDTLSGNRQHESTLLLRATLDLAEKDSAAVLFALAPGTPALQNMSQSGRSTAAALVGEAHLLEGRPADALLAFAEARNIAESWEARLEDQAELAGTSVSVMGEWLGLHAVTLEAGALLQLHRPLEAALLIERAHSARWRAAASTASGAPAAPLFEQDLRAWAANYEHGLVTWISGANSGIAIHIRADGEAEGHAVRVPRRDLERGARRLRAALIEGDDERAEHLSLEIVDAILPESLRASLLESSTNDGTLLCLAHGAIESLPLEALTLDGRVLDERAALLVLPGLPAKRPGDAPRAPAEWSLLGSPLGAAGELRLPAADLELADILSLRPRAHVWTQDIFGRTALVNAIESGHALHIATHLVRGAGCESQRYSDVGLELSGGNALCAQEIAALACSSPLVVLAACETAGGRAIDARGQQGLARAFLEAGARDLLVTLWPIQDEVARRFTPTFHRALLEGESPSRAARTARRALAESGVTAADWAAFRLLGRD